jgi:hypothetical protein
VVTGAPAEVGAEAGAEAVEAGAEAVELPDDPHAVASNARQAIAPAAATRRVLGELVISMSSTP